MRPRSRTHPLERRHWRAHPRAHNHDNGERAQNLWRRNRPGEPNLANPSSSRPRRRGVSHCSFRHSPPSEGGLPQQHAHASVDRHASLRPDSVRDWALDPHRSRRALHPTVSRLRGCQREAQHERTRQGTTRLATEEAGEWRRRVKRAPWFTLLLRQSFWYGG